MKAKKSNNSVNEAVATPFQTEMDMLAQTARVVKFGTLAELSPFKIESPVSLENVPEAVTDATVRAMLEPRNS
jgi:hypothetical protein